MIWNKFKKTKQKKTLYKGRKNVISDFCCHRPVTAISTIPNYREQLQVSQEATAQIAMLNLAPKSDKRAAFVI